MLTIFKQKPVVSYTINGFQPVTCSIIGDDPHFYNPLYADDDTPILSEDDFKLFRDLMYSMPDDATLALDEDDRVMYNEAMDEIEYLEEDVTVIVHPVNKYFDLLFDRKGDIVGFKLGGVHSFMKALEKEYYDKEKKK